MTQTLVESPPRERGASKTDADWSLLSPQGRVLFYIAFCPGCTISEIARAVGQTERAVWGILKRLRRSGMVTVSKKGRQNSFSINLEAPFLVPSLSGYSLRDVLGRLVSERRGRRSEQCLDEPE
jgi:hypothetical protein